jgi:hypothetical protein
LTAEKQLVIALVLSAGTLVWQICQVLLARSADARNREFEAYHRLIKEIVQPSEDGRTYIDRQCAAIFELRRFKRYRELTLRLLTGLREDWRKAAKLHPRLEKELELTLAALT